MRVSRSLNRRFVLQWLGLFGVLLALAAVIGYGLWSQYRHTEEQEQSRLLASSRMIEVDVEQSLEIIHRSLGQLARSVSRGETGDLGGRLARTVDIMPAVRTINVHDATGAIRWSSRAELVGINVSFSTRDYFRVPRQAPDVERLYVSPPFTTATGIYSFALTRVVLDPAGQFAGVVVATLDPEYFRRMLDAVRYAPDMVTSLRHEDGSVLMVQPPLGLSAAREHSAALVGRHPEGGRQATVSSGILPASGEDRMIVLLDVRPEGVGMDRGLIVASSRLNRSIDLHGRQDVWRAGGLFLVLVLATCVGLAYRQFRSAGPEGESGATPSPLRYRVFMQASVWLLTAAFLGIGGWIISLGKARADFEMAQEVERLKTAYEVSQAEMEHQLTVLARDLAADSGVSRWLLAAGQMQPGGGDLRQRLAPINAALQRHLEPRWANLKQAVDARQLQLVLPGSVSLLRLHSPANFGDSLRGVRLLLDEVERTRLPQSGFETGRAFSGIRGAAPVVLKTPAGGSRYLGAVELGVQFDGYIARIAARTGVGYGVLLKPEHAKGVMWKGVQPDAERATCCVLLTASRPELADWLAESRLPPYQDAAAEGRIEQHGKTFQIIRFPLADFGSKLGKAIAPIGSVVIWRDVTLLVEANRQYQWKVATYVALAYVLALVLLLLLLGASRREWRYQLAAKAEEVTSLLRQKEVLLDALGEGVYGVDRSGNTTFINAAAVRMLGVRAEDVVGHHQHVLFHHHRPDGSIYPETECPVHASLSDGQTRSLDEWFFRPDGSVFPVRLTVAAVSNHQTPAGVVVIFRDITEQKHKEEELVRLANTDGLTGIANRRYFTDQLTQEVLRAERTEQPAAVMMIDLDYFKLVNDAHGHAMGDRVLQHFVAVARRSLRKIDLLGRLGGEEFAALLPGSGLEAALEAAERLRSALANTPMAIEGGEIRVTVSIGVTLLRAGDASADPPLQRADEALYAAKTQGRNRVARST